MKSLIGRLVGLMLSVCVCISSGTEQHYSPQELEAATDEAGRLFLTSDEITQAIFRIEASPFQGTWENPPPDTLLASAVLSLRSTIRLWRQVAGSGPARLTANLAALDGPEALPLQRIDDQTYRLEADLSVGERNGRKKTGGASRPRQRDDQVGAFCRRAAHRRLDAIS